MADDNATWGRARRLLNSSLRDLHLLLQVTAAARGDRSGLQNLTVREVRASLLTGAEYCE